VSDALDTLERGAAALGALLGRLLAPLDSSAPGPGLKALVADMGWALPDPVPPALVGLKSGVTSLAHGVDDLDAKVVAGAGAGELIASAAQVVAALVKVVEALADLPSSLPAQLPPGFVAATNLPSAFAGRLFDVLIVDGLWSSLPLTSRILRVLGLIERDPKPADPAHFQPAYTARKMHWERIPQLLSDPQQVFKDVYGWGTSTLNAAPLQDALYALSIALGAPGTYDYPTPGLIKTVAPGAPAGTKPGRVFEFVLLDQIGVKVVAAVMAIPKVTPGEVQGLAVALVAEGSLAGLAIPITAHLTLTLDAAIDASAGVVLALRPDKAPELYANYDASASAVTSGHLTATLTYARADSEDPLTILAFPGGSRIEARSTYLTGGLGRTKSGDLDPSIEAGVKGGKFVLSLAQADGFLSKLLPADGLSLDFDLGVGWSRQLGVFVEGTAGLEISIPLHLDLGPVSLQWLFLALKIAGGELDLQAAISATGSLGPLSASVDKVGLTAVTTFPARGGNVGPANIALAFKPPNGVGLSIDAGVVKGGGYLYIDTDRGEYAGALELVFADFLSLHAIGLITTKMPDGSSGFSLLIIITAEFAEGIQLGFGFTLLGVGGLLGLNRTMLMQPLMDGVRTGAIESIMFPQDVVKNAQRIISDLRKIFPPQEGTFLIGPMAKIGWGEPTLISLALGIIIEIPPGDIAILGVLKLALPADDIALIVIQVNFAGALEFDKKRMYFFASLFDSRVLFITIEGEMGLLMAFGDDANFVVSIGGFHPQFKPPPLPFPTPRRIEIDILNEDWARIRVTGYFAVTSNSVQFGALCELYFGFSAINVQGHIGFDALIQFSPFHFIVSVSASLSVNVFGMGLFSIDLELSLEGPTPWHAHGTASISILFFSIDVSIDVTWGDSRDTALPPISVMPIVTGELGKQSNWRAVLPSGSNLLVSLRKLDPGEAEFVLHPVGTLQVSQRAIPLDLTLDKVGNQKPTDAKRFNLAVAPGGFVKKRDLPEQFAPAQFLNFDDAAKLSQQAYAPQHGGIELSAAGHAYASGTGLTRTVRYDLTIIDTKLLRTRRRFSVQNGALHGHFLRGASVARNVLSAYRKGQKDPFGDKVAVASESFAVALQANNSVYKPEAAAFASQAAANDYLARTVANDPSLNGQLHVLPQFEVTA
jgi:hypothetical protein